VVKEELSRVGLSINNDKSSVYSPTGTCPSGCEDWWANAGRNDGFLACGKPFGADGFDYDAAGESVVFPVGSRNFVTDFLVDYVQKVKRFTDEVRNVVTFAEPGEPAVQVANLLLRHCAGQKAAHLLRLLPPDLTADLATQVDSLVADCFAELNNLTGTDLDACRPRLYHQVALGGLGLRPLAALRAAAFFGSWSQCACSVSAVLGGLAPATADWVTRSLPFQQRVHGAVDLLRDDYGLDALRLCEVSWSDFAAVERPKRQKVLSQALLDVSAQRWLATASQRQLQTALSGSTSDKRPGAADWLTATPTRDEVTLRDDVYRFSVRLRLGLTLADPDDRCLVFNNSTHRTCGRQVSAWVDHAPGCAKAARNIRHNWLRDWWLKVAQEAGARAATEQEVVEYAPHVHIRCDVRATLGPGQPPTYYDVVVAHPFTTGVPTGSVGSLLLAEPSADAAVKAAAGGKRTAYAPPAGLPQVKLVPLAFDTFGRWGEDAALELRKLARMRAALPDVLRGRRSLRVQGAILSRWRTTASCLLQKGNYEVWADCVGRAAAVPDEEVGGETLPAFLDYFLARESMTV